MNDIWHLSTYLAFLSTPLTSQAFIVEAPWLHQHWRGQAKVLPAD